MLTHPVAPTDAPAPPSRVTARLGLLFALGVCGLLHVLTPDPRRISPAFPRLGVTIEGSFKLDGHYPGIPLPGVTRNLRLLGSWAGADENVGRLTLGPFTAPPILRFAFSGYPDKAGNELFLERKSSGERLPIQRPALGERWEITDVILPEAWVGTEVDLVARDNSGGVGGWLAISEPLQDGRGEGWNGLLESLAAWAINGFLLWLLWRAALEWLGRRAWFDPHWLPLVAGGAVAAAGYLAFWIYLANATTGKAFSLFLVLAGFLNAWRRAPEAALPIEAIAVARLTLAIGAFYLGLLHLYPSSRPFDHLAANRYRENLPDDNVLSHRLASALYRGTSPKLSSENDWQSSDRPPLQAGWQLLTWPLTATLRLEDRTASGTSAVWFQLLWVPAVFGLLRTLGLELRRAIAWTAVCSLGGFFIQNTVFVWPKLSAGALVCGSFALWVLTNRPPGDPRRRSEVCFGAGLAALGWLSHGGIAFSLLALAPWLLWRAVRGEWRLWCLAAGVFFLFAGPWLGYQKFYDPPGNRLLKMHLAGQEGVTRRGVWEEIREAYAPLRASEILAHKQNNLGYQVGGNWPALFQFSPAGAAQRRSDEFYLTGRALTWWLLGLAALPVILLRRAARQRLMAHGRRYADLALWIFLTIPIWCALMWKFAVIHHGSYALIIALFVLLSALLEIAAPWTVALVAGLQAATLATTYAVPNALVSGPAVGWPFLLVATVGLVIAATDRSRLALPASLLAALGTRSRRLGDAVRAWWTDPKLTWQVLLILGVLLALRHPSALTTPQLWAEDGSIFLVQDELFGGRAFAIPYAGYLHALPRLIAWTASHTLDPRWWPACYNWTAFALWLAVTARVFSPRLKLPGKPWLALACFLGPQTGEVLFNITNLQWITGLGLVQLALLERPANTPQRIGDLVWFALIGLTGPFVIIFLPLFAWRWSRERHADNLALSGLGVVCAGIQGWFLLHAGPHPEPRPEHFSLWPALVILARRLLIWPALGDRLAHDLPGALIGVVGILLLFGLLLRSWRTDPLRPWRTLLAAGFVLIVVASVLRTRPDGWGEDNLHFGDRYFYIPRVLLAWLLILEFDSTSRFMARTAKTLCFLIAVVHLRPYAVPAPPDYDWAAHCEPIRRGVKALIPTLPEGWTLEYHGRPER